MALSELTSHEKEQPPWLPQTPQLHSSRLSEGQSEHNGNSSYQLFAYNFIYKSLYSKHTINLI